MEITFVQGNNWPKADVIQWCDPYVIMKYTEEGSPKVFKTSVQKNTSEPKWDQSIEVKELSGELVFECWDWDRMNSDDLLGTVKIPIPDFQEPEKTVTLVVVLDDSYKKKRKNNNMETTITIAFKHSNVKTPTKVNSLQETLKQEEEKKRIYLKDYIPVLKNFTGKTDFSLLFSSDIFSIDPEVLHTKIYGKRNLMLLIITENGCSFGSFNEQPILGDAEGNDDISKDDNGCIFSIVGPMSDPTRFNVKNPNATSLCLFNGKSQSQDVIIGVNGAFYIKKDKSVYELPSIGDYYDIGGSHSVLLGQFYPITFPISKFLVLQWN
ncbi:hypothetical protein KM1_067380 [Entamoeba histolytica HM-3:IMSS]|uniref:C2 domain containing protein n=2 Tax=Entamoeba histolytica TaxID=5759 RepID=M2Q7C8_ENTHI|nr:C2 domain containing protein [Entamoeba histolytica KU27]EMS11621.1 hypothetical protein KM1_067380 [Entamoeba histolytica HM-3:IMSS]